MKLNQPILTTACIDSTTSVSVVDESSQSRTISIAGEYPLTLYVDKQEIVTLMTLGQMPEALSIGWLRNQRLLDSLDDIEEVRIDWEVNVAAVYTRCRKISPIVMAQERQTITSGCGQGTMFSHLMEDINSISFCRTIQLGRTALFDLLRQIRLRETVYKTAGAVHGCALATYDEASADIIVFVEDIGRHNAVDAIAGWMLLEGITGDNKVFYTTGRLTSEMVIKCAQMQVPYLVSRSGVTKMGYDVANQVGLTVLGRAINQRYIVFSGAEYFGNAG